MRATSLPSSRYSPLVGRSRQPRMCMSVDLPEPDGPVTATNSPFSTSMFAPRRARTVTSPTMYVLTRSLTAMTAMARALSSSPAAAPTTAAAAGTAPSARATTLRSHQRIVLLILTGLRALLQAGGHGDDDFGPLW